MHAQKEYHERRRHPRYTVKNGPIAVLHANSEKILGPIVDVSLTGLCFSYIDNDREFNRKTGLEVDIKNNGSSREDVPCDVVWTGRAESHSPFNVVRMKKSGVRFKELHPDLVTWVEDFIAHNSVRMEQEYWA